MCGSETQWWTEKEEKKIQRNMKENIATREVKPLFCARDLDYRWLNGVCAVRKQTQHGHTRRRPIPRLHIQLFESKQKENKSVPCCGFVGGGGGGGGDGLVGVVVW